MKFYVIEGGLSEAASKNDANGDALSPSMHDVKTEAARRIKDSGYEEWRVREFVTGAPIPSALKYLRMQIEFAAEALTRLSPIPHDFRADAYWPTK
ncbi:MULTISPECIES: hypothetical protein [unclassified Sinorhizobium]|uniref:hypothetical protein n=1 Tax=unclassified Sinorhizobium TaxID=2613772 RepID=UPI00352635DC